MELDTLKIRAQLAVRNPTGQSFCITTSCKLCTKNHSAQWALVNHFFFNVLTQSFNNVLISHSMTLQLLSGGSLLTALLK